MPSRAATLAGLFTTNLQSPASRIAVHLFDSRHEVAVQTVNPVCAASYAPWENPPAGCGRRLDPGLPSPAPH